MGFVPTIPASERAKTVLALDRSATVTGTQRNIGPHLKADVRIENRQDSVKYKIRDNVTDKAGSNSILHKLA
jgi:hypothetical protein